MNEKEQKQVEIIKAELLDIVSGLDGENQNGDLTWLSIEINILKRRIDGFLEMIKKCGIKN